MLKNYFKTAFRALRKNKLYSAINIIGLSVSLSAAILLLLWVWDELSFDRMHSKGERIYNAEGAIDNETENFWGTSAPLALFGKAEIPSIEAACRIYEYGNEMLVDYHGKKFNEKTTYVDSSFFTVFDFHLVEGNQGNPFPDTRSIVLTKNLAKKYFGEEPALGKVVIGSNHENYKVTGIINDMPSNSSLQFDLLLPFDILGENRQTNPLNTDWGNFNYSTYFLLRAGANSHSIGKQLADIHRKNQPSEFYKDLNYLLQPLHQVHLYDPRGKEQGMQQVKIFLLVSIVILLIACINYVNLVTARSTRRTKEISVRKVVGASRFHLFWQFIAESIVVFGLSMLLAIAIIYAIMPFYNELSGKEMAFGLLDGKIWGLFGLTLLTVLLMAGVYPAVMLSSFSPVLALKGILPGLGKNGNFRKALVVTQFTISIVLIISTLIIGRQLKYIRHKNLGYTKENVFTFKSLNFSNRYESIRDELQNQPGILGVTTSQQSILRLGSSTGDIVWEGKPDVLKNFVINQFSADRNFIDVLNMELIMGKGFSGTPADSSNFILNETAIKQMGLEDPIGKPISFHEQPGFIAGVVKDFHFKNMKTSIEPCIIFMDPNWGWRHMYVKTTAKDAELALSSVKKLWKQYNADYNFEYQFMDEAFDELYKSDIRAGQLFNIFAGIAILLSCLGLFGLVTYTAESKVKEIGIRKTLGASVSNIILLISKDFMKLVSISFVASFPIAWWMMSLWLNNYVYRTTIQIWIFVLAGLIAFIIAAVTVCGQALKAARNNPIKAIRTE